MTIRVLALTELRPSYPHEAMSKLMELDMLKYIISQVPENPQNPVVIMSAWFLTEAIILQNCDGLHILSGVPKNKIAELHGSSRSLPRLLYA